jgi:hypothetical protein
MEYKKALDVLLLLLKKDLLNDEEKEAISVAVGFLSWAYLAKNKLKARKEKRDRDSTSSFNYTTRSR